MTEGIGQRTEKRHKNPHRTQDIGHRQTYTHGGHINQTKSPSNPSKVPEKLLKKAGVGRGEEEEEACTYTIPHYTIQNPYVRIFVFVFGWIKA